MYLKNVFICLFFVLLFGSGFVVKYKYDINICIFKLIIIVIIVIEKNYLDYFKYLLGMKLLLVNNFYLRS